MFSILIFILIRIASMMIRSSSVITDSDHPNQMREVLLFLYSKISDETKLSSKLPVADRTCGVRGKKLCY